MAALQPVGTLGGEIFHLRPVPKWPDRHGLSIKLNVNPPSTVLFLLLLLFRCLTQTEADLVLLLLVAIPPDNLVSLFGAPARLFIRI